MKSTIRHNRQDGREYGARRPQPRDVSARAGRAEPSPRGRAEGSAQPSRLAYKASLLDHLRRLTQGQIIVLCVTALLCVCVPAALAMTVKPDSAPVSAETQRTGLSAQLDGSAPETTPVPTPQSPTPIPTPTLPPHPSHTIIRQGTTAPVVLEIQARLMALGFMDEDEPTDYYGPVTSGAISLFQRQHRLSVDGEVGMETFTLLMSADAKPYTVEEGYTGNDVKELQERLRELGYLDAAATGRFGEMTTKAVKDFQRANGLAADGKVGQKTFDVLFSPNVKPNFKAYDGQTAKLKSYQQRLSLLVYLTTSPDGKYGKDTIAAVKRFQEINDLFPDGFLGPSTVSRLLSGSAKPNALMMGMEGDNVKNVQKKLCALGYMSHATGYFGTETENGVKAFQKRNGLTVDGTVGKQTRDKLESGTAKRAAGSSGGSSGGSSSTPTTGVNKLISVAQGKLGCKYVWGAKGPNTFDCSGFVYYCLNQAGVKQGYLSSDGWAKCTKFQKITSISNLKRGDIVVFSGTSVGHVGIYLGNGSMIDASSAHGKVVKRTGIWNGSYWKSVFICGFRVF